MTRRRKTTTIITETDRLLIFNRRSGAVEGWCDSCDDLAGMVRPDEAAALAGFRLNAVYRSLELNKLRSIIAPLDELEVRLDSLLKPA
ncbi:MAG TPA: hypothetical protein VI455_17420 [Terriglobia bacterium]